MIGLPACVAVGVLVGICGQSFFRDGSPASNGTRYAWIAMANGGLARTERRSFARLRVCADSEVTRLGVRAKATADPPRAFAAC